MPHKHKRKADDATADDFDLPPTSRAVPLPVGKSRAPNPAAKKRKTSSNKSTNYGADDTPKAFARLMAFKARGKGPKGLDDGNDRRSKSKSKNKNNSSKSQQDGQSQNPTAAADGDDGDAAPNSESQPPPQQPALKILPGESLSEFSQRVNQALPLSTVSRSSKKIAGLADHRITRHEKKLKKLQAGWRAEEARLRDKEAEARELAEEEEDELEDLWEDKTADLPAGGKKGKGKKGKGRKKVVGEVDDGEDPWEALQRKREQRKGLHDVVTAPPTFDRVPREVFKVKNGARVNVGNVPTSAGSLMRREQLGEERMTIIDTYRKLMAAKKEGN
jgi:hypothetical protein